MAPYPVFRQVGADVEIPAQARQVRVAGLGNRQNRTGLGVRLGKAQKIVGEGLGQDYQIGLDIAAGEPGGWAAKPAGTDTRPRVRTGFDSSICCCAHHPALSAI